MILIYITLNNDSEASQQLPHLIKEVVNSDKIR